MSIVVGSLILGVLASLIVGAVMDFKHLDAVDNAKTTEQLKKACIDGWYNTLSIQKLPAVCLQFYNK